MTKTRRVRVLRADRQAEGLDHAATFVPLTRSQQTRRDNLRPCYPRRLAAKTDTAAHAASFLPSQGARLCEILNETIN